MSARRTRGSGTPFPVPVQVDPSRLPSPTPCDPDAVLAALPVGTPDYKRVLGAILKMHNHEHSAKPKGVSFKTMLDRQRFLVSFFRELRHHAPIATSTRVNSRTATSR